MRIIVPDTNCLLVSLPTISPYHKLWTNIMEGRICMCVSNANLEEYEEIIGLKTTPTIAKSVIQLILSLPNPKRVTPTYYFNLIEDDPDDNKFVDCAFCGEAESIVTNDKHFNALKHCLFPKISVVTIQEFLELLP